MTKQARAPVPSPDEKRLYTAKTHATGGRENGASRSSDGRLDVKLPSQARPRIGTNPEQLLAAGRSACFESAIGIAARKMKVSCRLTSRSMRKST